MRSTGALPYYHSVACGHMPTELNLQVRQCLVGRYVHVIIARKRSGSEIQFECMTSSSKPSRQSLEIAPAVKDRFATFDRLVVRRNVEFRGMNRHPAASKAFHRMF